jgi:Outer membrane protein beta-barrel domain
MHRLLLGVFVLLVAAPAHAQSTDFGGRFAIGGQVGTSKTWDDEGGLGTGPGYGGFFSTRLREKLLFIADVERLSHERIIAGGSLEFVGDSTLVTAGLSYRFSTSRVQPYVLGVAGVNVYSGTRTIREAGPTPSGPFGPATVLQKEGTDFTLGFGGGLDIFLTSRFSVRPEVRFFLIDASDNSNPHAAARLSIGAAVHW